MIRPVVHKRSKELRALWAAHFETVKITIRANSAIQAGNIKRACDLWAFALRQELRHIEILRTNPRLQLLRACHVTAAYLCYFLRRLDEAERLAEFVASEIDEAAQLLQLIRFRKWGCFGFETGEWIAPSAELWDDIPTRFDGKELDRMLEELSDCRRGD